VSVFSGAEDLKNCKLLIRAKRLPQEKMADLLDECMQLGKIIAQSIVTARGSNRKR
jgi:hypothetical protein